VLLLFQIAGLGPVKNLEDAMAHARTVWPDVELDLPVFAAYLGELGDDLAGLDLPALYLGCACIHGDPRALAAFEASYLDQVPRFLSRVTADRDLIDEVKQQLRIKLFVADGDRPPKISRYRRGSLTAWLRVVTTHLAIDLLRERSEPIVNADDRELEHRALTADPRLAALQASYGPEVSRAFGESLAALPAEERTLLRLCFVDDLGMAEIGRIYQLSKSAVSRRLSRCRDRVLSDVRRRLREDRGLADAELDSIMRLVTSQLHVSLRRLLDA
jgi:RNA polymerase sigma-70 factor (ECF subfamily)